MKRVKRLSIITLLVAISVLLGASPVLAQTYIVQKGDSLFLIGQRFGVSTNEIKSANKLKSDTIYPAQKIHVNTKSSSLPNKNNPSQSNRYVFGFYVDKEPYLPSSYNLHTCGSSMPSLQIAIPPRLYSFTMFNLWVKLKAFSNHTWCSCPLLSQYLKYGRLSVNK